jgi:O-antigen ligase
VLALISLPEIGRRSTRLLDAALGASLLAIALQLVPLSAALRAWAAPATVAYERAVSLAPRAAAARPLTTDPGATLFALVVVATTVLLFWSMRTMFQNGGLRSTIRAITWFGLLVSPIAIVQHLMPLPLLDGVWGLTPRGLRPYGPFVNRNDFAAWLIMAIPLTLGYAIARIESRRVSGAFDREAALDGTSLWLALALALMLAGLLFSMSRSGLVGAVAGLSFFVWRARHRLTGARAAWSIAGAGTVFAVAAMFADMTALSVRLEGTVSEGLTGRLSIWRQTLPMIGDFWLVGSGVGTYQTVMVSYQTMSRFFYISHADNELLQILAEGGLLLAVPAVLVVVAGLQMMTKRAREDSTPIFWLRIGASAGMLALAAQNMVEMTLRVPANATLFAILAAVAMHRPQAERSASTASQTAGSSEKFRG